MGYIHHTALRNQIHNNDELWEDGGSQGWRRGWLELTLFVMLLLLFFKE